MRAERQHFLAANTVCLGSVNAFPKLSDFQPKIGQFWTRIEKVLSRQIKEHYQIELVAMHRGLSIRP